MDGRKSNDAAGDARFLQITRDFDAPRSMVFEAWTDPQQLVRWYAPEGCQISFRQLDLRTGGRFHSCIHTPQGHECWCIGEYLEITAPERIVFTMVAANSKGEPVLPVDVGMHRDWPRECVVSVTFEDLAGRTRLSLHQTVDEALAKRTGAHPSWLAMLDRLAQLVTQLGPAPV